MKPRTKRRLARQLYNAILGEEDSSVAVSLTCHAAFTSHGIDSRDTLRAIGGVCLGHAKVDQGEGTKVLKGTAYAVGEWRYLRCSSSLVLDVTEATPISKERLVGDLTAPVSVIDAAAWEDSNATV